MKKLLLAVFVSLVASTGFAQVDEPTDADIEKMMQAYKAFKAKQNTTPKEEANPQARYERALLEAAKEGNASQVRGLLEQGINPNVRDADGNTPLIYAAHTSLPAVDMLLFAGADVNAKNQNGLTPLVNAFLYGTPNREAMIKRILKEKPNVNVIAYKWNDGTVVRTTAIQMASILGNLEIVDTLIAQGADVNKCLATETALGYALESKSSDSTKVVESLLKAGADPYRPDGTRKTPLDYANASGDKAKIKLIKDAMATGKVQREKDKKLLKATTKGKVEEVKKLLASGANPNTYADYDTYVNDPFNVHSNNKTPLMLAKDMETAQALLSAGADVNIVDGYGYTALHWTLNTPEGLERAKWLIKNGANLNVLNSSNRTPLLHSMRRQWWDKAQLLLNAGADVTVRDIDGHNALFFASKYENKPLIKELMKRGLRLTAKEKEEITKYLTEQAQANADGGDGLGNTVVKGLVNTGVSALEYSLTK